MSRREVEDWFSQLGGELHRLNQEISGARPRVATCKSWEPRIDLLEEQSRFLVKAEIAGVSSEHIQLLYVPERHSIMIRGVREEADYSDGIRTGIHMLEIFYGPFQREVKLPDVPVDASNIRAQYVSGLLVIHIPKSDRLVVTRTITIKEI